MQFSFATVAAFAALVSSSAAHMIMHDPPQWAVPGESLGPLDFEGADFPCANGVADPTASRTYTAGSAAKLQLQGSAVHGGGSGQMIITYDFPPTRSSVWRVMQSWEGDHPIKAAGNLPANPYLIHDPISFAVPAGLPSGKAVVAWSWFNRIGNREMYMKCATVQINGKDSSVSDLSQDPGMTALPTFFRANSGNGCVVPEGVDAIAFKNPGANLIVAPGYTPTSIPCDDSLPGSGAGSDTPAPSGTTIAPEPTSIYEPSPTATDAPVSTETSYPGGDEESGNGDDTEEPVISTVPAPTATATKTPTQPIATASATASPDAACPEGKVYCNDDNTWSMCGSGYIQKIGQIPNGMQCVNGEFSAKVSSKRAIRFSPEHMRRRHH
jgi:hypothetical protein